ncbi:MAG TPA: hypothetical protein V6D17_10390 [Candidatus Obscuribacterales bacterium]
MSFRKRLLLMGAGLLVFAAGWLLCGSIGGIISGIGILYFLTISAR